MGHHTHVTWLNDLVPWLSINLLESYYFYTKLALTHETPYIHHDELFWKLSTCTSWCYCLSSSIPVCFYNIIGRTSVFLSQPSSFSVDITETASITCYATDYNVTYQWIIKSGSFPSKVIDTNTSTLVIPDVTSSDENTYTCVATTVNGCVSSNTAQLVVTGMIYWYNDYHIYKVNYVGFPTITVTPSNQSVEVTLATMFTATVTGVGPFTYQWWRGKEILKNEIGSTYTVYNASTEDQSYYRCHVFNTLGDSAVSDRVWLQVISMCMFWNYSEH